MFTLIWVNKSDLILVADVGSNVCYSNMWTMCRANSCKIYKNGQAFCGLALCKWNWPMSRCVNKLEHLDLLVTAIGLWPRGFRFESCHIHMLNGCSNNRKNKVKWPHYNFYNHNIPRQKLLENY